MPSVAQIKHTLSQGTGTSKSATFDAATQSRNCIVVFIFWKLDVNISSVTDTQGNVYVASPAGRIARPLSGYLHMYVAKNIQGGSTTVTVTFASSMDFNVVLQDKGSTTFDINLSTTTEAPVDDININLAEYQDIHRINALGTGATGTNTTGAVLTSDTFTPTYSKGVIIYYTVSYSPNATPGLVGGVQSVDIFSLVGEQALIAHAVFNASLGSNITASCTWESDTGLGGSMVVLELQGADPEIPTNQAEFTKLRPAAFFPGIAR